MKGIIDTGFIVAFLNKGDQHHKWAVSLARNITQPLLTCEAVLAEAAFHVKSTSAVLELLSLGFAKLAITLQEHDQRILELAKKYEDREPDLADLCLIVLNELHPKLPVITTDRKDFQVYRRFSREKIPLVLPPSWAS